MSKYVTGKMMENGDVPLFIVEIETVTTVYVCR